MRTKIAIINLITDLLPQIIIAILGLFKIKIFISFLGTSQVGLYQLYTQILAYLVLIEGGMGTAVLFSLYRPISDNNQNKIDAIMLAAKKIFRKITFFMLIIGIILSFNINFFIKEQEFSTQFLMITFCLYLFSQIIVYLTVPERQMFDARQKKYIPNIIYQTVSIITSICEIIAVILGGNILLVIFIILIFNIISNILLVIIYKKFYGKFNKEIKPDYSITKDVKHLFVNTAGLLITNNIDVLIISKCIGLSSVVIYTSYNYICSTITKMIEKITGATMSGIANIIIEGKEKAYNLLLEFNSLIFYIATIIAIPLLYSISPFIKIFYKGDITTNNILSILFTIILFYQIIKIPLRTYTFAAGEFKKVKKYVIAECIINLSMSLILVQFMGISGVLIGTIISLLLCDYFPKSQVIFKKILQKDSKAYHKNNVFFLIIALTLGVGVYNIPYKPNNMFMWIIATGIIFIVNMVIVTIFYKLKGELYFIKRFNLKKIFKKGNSNA